jgi:hypothetical protein
MDYDANDIVSSHRSFIELDEFIVLLKYLIKRDFLFLYYSIIGEEEKIDLSSIRYILNLWFFFLLAFRYVYLMDDMCMKYKQRDRQSRDIYMNDK